MDYKQSPALIVIAVAQALLLLAPLAYGVPTVDNANFTGRICCTSTGNCASRSIGISGVNVNLNCTNLSGGPEMLGQGVTNTTGQFIIQVNGSIGPIFPGDVPPCDVFVNLPLNSTVCPILDMATGTLVGALTLVDTIFDPMLGFVSRIRVRSFSNVTIGG